MKKLLLAALALSISAGAHAEVTLCPLFSDNMVFQQNTQAPVWGKAAPGATVSVTPSWSRKTITAIADAEGRWKVTVATPKGSFRKYTLTISDGTPVVLHNVAVGEVWLASGQSNMERTFGHPRFPEFYKDDIAASKEWADIRMLTVSRATGMVERDFFQAVGGGWELSSPETLPHFSTAAWYFARRLMQELKVPVGILHTSWGGTVIEAWMGRESLADYPEMAIQLDLVKVMPDDEQARNAAFARHMESYLKMVGKKDPGLAGSEAVWAQTGFDDGGWKSITLPCLVQKVWPGTNGIFWFRREIDIPAEWAGHDLTLSLGPVDDFDETYWNGVQVGSGRIYSEPRKYTVPADLVREGRAVICIRNVDDHGNGGLYGDAALMYLEGPGGQKLPLDGEWKVELSCDFKGMPKYTVREPNLATVLYNAMLRPLAPYAIKGAIWYQGESNADRAFRYRDLMASMILGWRSLWGYDFPFYITQLAGFRQVSGVPGEDTWAELRESQTVAVQSVDKAGMACIIDIGEADDIHPVNKYDVGYRLARLALANDYGRKVVCNGPRMASFRILEGSIAVRFSDVAGGLEVRPSGAYAELRYGKTGMDSELVRKAEAGELCGFQIAGPDRVWHWADAKISGDEVIVSSPEVRHPVAVRYAWSVNPVCNLFNSEGLPAWPFRTDSWPGITD